MNPVPDRKKLRRAYLSKKGKAYAKAAVLSILFVPTIALCCALWSLAWGFTHAYASRIVDVPSWLGLFVRVIAAGSLIVGTVVCSVLCRALWRTIDAAHNEAKRIPWVPSVTPSTLPAEEILVRGAAEPSAPNETLLRAGVKGEATKAEQLLRSSQGG
jgi:hypothetical protein